MMAMITGNITRAAPSTRTRCEKKVSTGRFSTSISVLHFLLDEAELDDRERHHDQHQHHGLRGRSIDVERLEAVVVKLVDEDRRLLARAAVRGRIDDGKGLEESVD